MKNNFLNKIICFCKGHKSSWSVDDADDYCQRCGAKLKEDEDETDEAWMCVCGHYIEDGFHCPHCGQEPPWGCPCSDCECPDEFDDVYDDYGDLPILRYDEDEDQ